MKKRPIYLDYNATTPLAPVAFEAMKTYLSEEFGNASSSSHSYGWACSQAVEKARKTVAQVIKSKPKEIVFTSGATESNNMAITGTVLLNPGCHIISSAIEHKAVLQVCEHAETLGAEVTILQPDEHGQISVQQVRDALKPNTKLISLMLANNEIGTLNPIKEIGALAKENNITFHTDAAQGFGKIAIDVEAMNIDLLSVSGHKIYGPKGIGALYVREGVELSPIIIGGQQERGLRPGTLNVAGIVGLGAASELALNHGEEECARLRSLRDELIQKVLDAVPEARLNGHPKERLCNNISFSFEGLSADLFTLGLSGLALSSGSACTSGDPNPSHVLTALGHPPELARSTLRISIGMDTKPEDIQIVVDKIIALSEKNQKISAT